MLAIRRCAATRAATRSIQRRYPPSFACRNKLPGMVATSSGTSRLHLVAQRSRERHRIERFHDYARGPQRLEVIEFARLRSRGHENDRNVGGLRGVPQMSEARLPVRDAHAGI